MNNINKKLDKWTLKKELFIKALQENMGIIKYACKKAKISRSTYYNWIKKDQQFSDHVDEITEGVGDDVEAMLLRNIKDGKESSIIFYCKTKLKHRGYTETVDLNTCNTQPHIMVVPPSAKNAEEWERTFRKYQITVDDPEKH